MNRDESLELYAKGKDAWNAWAEGMLGQRETLGFEGNWETERKAWESETQVDFTDYEFNEPVDFDGFMFPHAASFDGAKFFHDAGFIGAIFIGHAEFDKATFFKYAWFDEATFSEAAWFDGATFKQIALFNWATFSDIAHFEKVTFSGEAWFDEATFKQNASFRSSEFNKFAMFGYARFTSKYLAANFVAIRSQSQFTLNGASFSTVPDFEQAHFNEAPSLDKISITSEVSSPFGREKTTNDENDTSAHWRHLRRLAQEGHDHEREMDFLAGDILSRRGVIDHAFGKNWPLFWVGLFYQWVSNFGRSIFRPLLWWFGSMIFFAHSYLFANVLPRFGAKTPLLDAECFHDFGSAIGNALNLSFARSSVVGNLWARDGVTRAMQCLYNTDNGPFKADEPTVHLPGWVIASGYAQTLFSAVMIFLFLLAVRNHFRIR